MSLRLVSFRRRLAVLAAGAAGCLVLLVLAQGQAAGKPGAKCAKGAEKSGCKLPIGARWQWPDHSKEGDDSIAAEVTPKGWVSTTLQNATIDCREYGKYIGDEVELEIGLTIKQRPKVGKTYKVSKSESSPGGGEEGEGPSSSETALTLEFKTAKRVVATVVHRSSADGEVICNGGKTWTLKRQPG